MFQLTIQVLSELYSIHRLNPSQAIPPEIFAAPLYFLAKTGDELSIVCPSDLQIAAVETEPDWRCLKVLGPLDFGLTGILAGLATSLSEAQVSIFAVSTYETDYLLVQQNNLAKACQALARAGHRLEDSISE